MKLSKEWRDHFHAEYMKENFWLRKAEIFFLPVYLPVIFAVVLSVALAGAFVTFFLVLAESLSDVYHDFIKGYFRRLYTHLRYWNKKAAADYICYSTMDDEK